MVLMDGLIHAFPRVIGLRINDPSDPLLCFSWWWGIAITIGYTWLVFGGKKLWNDGTSIISKQNAKPIEVILAIHLGFLAVILGLVWMIPFVLSLLHSRMSDSYNDSRAFAILIMGVMIGMFYIERKWLFAESVDDDSDCDDNSAESSNIEDDGSSHEQRQD